MKAKTFFMQRLFAIGVILSSFTASAVFGQTLSSSTRKIFAADAKPTAFLQEGVSVPNNESTPAFSPDGQILYLANNYNICISIKDSDEWTKPSPISFTEHWKDWDPALSPDGKRLVFVSNRTWPGADKNVKSNHLWYSELLSNGRWADPRHMDAPVNTEGVNAYAPSVSRAGSICFCSRDRDGRKRMHGFYTKWAGDHYKKPELLALNGNEEIYDPYIDADERYIIFASDGNLFISYHTEQGWSAGQKLGPQVNNGGVNGSPYVSPDGKTLYYSSSLKDCIMMIPVDLSGLKNQ